MPADSIRRGLAAGLLALVLAMSGGGDAAARSVSRYSGGYARPSLPSTSLPSGGYRRPDDFGLRPPIGQPSPGDRAIARQQAEDALRSYRGPQAGARLPVPETPRSPSGLRIPYGSGYDPWARQGGWYRQRGWAPPPYTYGAARSFGVWDALFLWFLLDTLSRPGHAQFFYDHQNDPGYQQWRAQADQLAQSNADLRAKLDRLDQSLAGRQGEKRDPQELPSDTPPEVAVAPQYRAAASSASPSFSPGATLAVVVIGGGILFLLWRGRRHLAGAPGASSKESPGMESVKSAIDHVRRKVTGERYTPSFFRIGMTLTFDPTPFILAGQVTKVPPPQPAGADHLVNVTAVGTLGDGVTLHRLYLDEQSFFQLHLDGDGRPDECRFFGRIDQVAPSSPEEWGFWIDPAEGVVGWPEFQTKDGKRYARVWSPGATRIAPHRFTETRQEIAGVKTARLEAMLYGAPTGAVAPAPPHEYILVAMVEAGGEAWIDIHAGFDVNPAALSLS